MSGLYWNGSVMEPCHCLYKVYCEKHCSFHDELCTNRSLAFFSILTNSCVAVFTYGTNSSMLSEIMCGLHMLTVMIN